MYISVVESMFSYLFQYSSSSISLYKEIVNKHVLFIWKIIMQKDFIY